MTNILDLLSDMNGEKKKYYEDMVTEHNIRLLSFVRTLLHFHLLYNRHAHCIAFCGYSIIDTN